MSCLLFGGSPNTGKSGAILRFAHFLVSSPHYVTKGTLPPLPTGQNHPKDFLILLNGVDINGQQITIVVNSATDDPATINALKKFCSKHNPNFIISSVRADPDPMRPLFFNCMGNFITNNDVEIPLAKIHKNSSNWHLIKQWYEGQIDTVAKFIIHNQPFLFV